MIKKAKLIGLVEILRSYLKNNFNLGKFKTKRMTSYKIINNNEDELKKLFEKGVVAIILKEF